MREVLFEAENGVKVYIDKDVKDWDSSARRPYYRLRGARITEEQAFEVIRRTDTFFTWTIGTDDFYRDSINSLNFNMWWFFSSHYPEKYGWVHPDGVVGHNGITQKYPNIEELIDEWTEYALSFPFLDLVIGITWWDERCTEYFHQSDELHELFYVRSEISEEEYYRRDDELDLADLERKDFEESISVGVWVHDGIVEIMDKERTAEKYLEYERLYEEPDSRIYIAEYNSIYRPDIVTRDYLLRCIAGYGIDDPEKFLNEHYRAYETENLR